MQLDLLYQRILIGERARCSDFVSPARCAPFVYAFTYLLVPAGAIAAAEKATGVVEEIIVTTKRGVTENVQTMTEAVTAFFRAQPGT